MPAISRDAERAGSPSSARRILLFAGPMILWMAVIFAFSTRIGESEHSATLLETILRFFAPGWVETAGPEAVGDINHYLRKAGHFTEYFILFLLALRTVRFGRPQATLRMAICAWLIAAGYAITDEFHQSFVDGRSASLVDAVIDSSGALLGFAVVSIRGRLKRKTTGSRDT